MNIVEGQVQNSVIEFDPETHLLEDPRSTNIQPEISNVDRIETAVSLFFSDPQKVITTTLTLICEPLACVFLYNGIDKIQNPAKDHESSSQLAGSIAIIGAIVIAIAPLSLYMCLRDISKRKSGN